jgi:hypothetical protein
MLCRILTRLFCALFILSVNAQTVPPNSTSLSDDLINLEEFNVGEFKDAVESVSQLYNQLITPQV